MCIRDRSGSLGAFTDSADVGNPARKGSTEFNAATGQYRITGSGANIWEKQDQFQFVWREMSGNFALTATMEFLGKGEDHRKAGIMLRQSSDTDAAYVDVIMHGNGMPALQWLSLIHILCPLHRHKARMIRPEDTPVQLERFPV